MNNLDQKILQKIREEKITPKSKWLFQLKWWTIRLAILLSLLLASATFAVILKILFEGEFNFAKLLSGGYLIHFARLTGLTWLGFSVLALVLLKIEIRNSKYGYRVPDWLVLVGSIVVSLALGYVLYKSGYVNKIEKPIARVFPPANFEEFKVQIWHQPAKGLFVGTLLQDYYNDASQLSFTDINGNMYTLDLTHISPIDKLVLEHASLLVVLGELKDNTITVCAVKPIFQEYELESKHTFRQSIKNIPAEILGDRKGIFGSFLHADETSADILRKSKCKGNSLQN